MAHVTNALRDALDVTTKHLVPHRVNAADMGRHNRCCLKAALKIEDCTLLYVRHESDVTIDFEADSDYVLISTNYDNDEGLPFSDPNTGQALGDISIATGTWAGDTLMTSACSHLVVRISRSALEKRVSEILGRRPPSPLQFAAEIEHNSDFGRAWHQLTWHLCYLSARAPSILSSGDVCKRYSGMLIELLMHAAPHNYSQAFTEINGSIIPRYVRRAREYMHSHLKEIRSIGQIALLLGVSQRTLQIGFRRSLNTTPAEYLRDIRISALHQSLLGARPGQNVGELMHAVGILNYSHYARYYRDKIGVAPSATLRGGV